MPGMRAPAPALALVVALVAGCGGSSQSAPPPSQGGTPQDAASIDARLRGTWRLADYQPEVALEPMLQQLLAMQVQSMTIHFEGGHMRADSPTLHLDRPYQVTEATPPLFKVVSPDVGGGTLVSSCQISDDGTRISFHGETEPWRGTGSLVRLGP
jgi:hypothetical protein